MLWDYLNKMLGINYDLCNDNNSTKAGTRFDTFIFFSAFDDININYISTISDRKLYILVSKSMAILQVFF